LRCSYLIILVLLVSLFFGVNSAFADVQNLLGTSHGFEISLTFSDEKVSGTITSENHAINLDNAKIMERKSGFLILDRQNDLKILLMQKSTENYLVIVKINSDDLQTKLRFIASSDNIIKNTTQRNLFDAMKQKQAELQKEKLGNLTFKELQLLEKQKAIDGALKIHDDRVKRIAEELASKTFGDRTQSILDKFKKSQELTGMGLVVVETKDVTETTSTETTSTTFNKPIKVFFSVPHHQEWKRVLIYEILVTDDVGHRYDSLYNSFVGNPLSDVDVSGMIKNPEGVTIQQFNGITDSFGEYLGTYLIPDQSTTRGEYVISADAVQTFEDGTIEESSGSGTFFVFPSSSGSSNQPPISNAGPDQVAIVQGSLVTLDGSGSSDPNADSITYSWTQTGGVAVIGLSSNTATSPTFTAPAATTVVVFQLTVTDTKSETSTDSVSISVD